MSKETLRRAKLAELLTPYLFTLAENLENIKSDRTIKIGKTVGDLTRIEPIPPGEKSGTALRSHYMATVVANPKARKPTILTDPKVRAFMAKHLIYAQYASSNGAEVYSGYACTEGLVKVPLTDKNMHLMSQKDFSLVHDSKQDVRKYYKIRSVADLPTTEVAPGVFLPVCDMRYIIARARKDVDDELKKLPPAPASAADDTDGAGAGDTALSSRQRKIGNGLVSVLDKLHELQTLAMGDNGGGAGQRLDKLATLPPMLLGADVARVEALLGYQYKALERSVYNRPAFFPLDFIIEHDRIAALLESLKTAEGDDGDGLPLQMDTVPFLQATLLIAMMAPVDQPFWTYAKPEITRDGTMGSEFSQESVHVWETNPMAQTANQLFLTSLENARKIFAALKQMRSALLVTMAPTLAACLLMTKLGTFQKVTFEYGPEQEKPVCAISGRVIESGESGYCVMAPVNPFVTGQANDTQKEFLVFFMAASFLTVRVKISDAVTLAPAPDEGADMGLDATPWEPPQPLTEPVQDPDAMDIDTVPTPPPPQAVPVPVSNGGGGGGKKKHANETEEEIKRRRERRRAQDLARREKQAAALAAAAAIEVAAAAIAPPPSPTRGGEKESIDDAPALSVKPKAAPAATGKNKVPPTDISAHSPPAKKRKKNNNHTLSESAAVVRLSQEGATWALGTTLKWPGMAVTMTVNDVFRTLVGAHLNDMDKSEKISITRFRALLRLENDEKTLITWCMDNQAEYVAMIQLLQILVPPPNHERKQQAAAPTSVSKAELPLIQMLARRAEAVGVSRVIDLGDYIVKPEEEYRALPGLVAMANDFSNEQPGPRGGQAMHAFVTRTDIIKDMTTFLQAFVSNHETTEQAQAQATLVNSAFKALFTS